jgi:Zn-dependent M28 family amino/carboxypeptidase
VHLPVPPGATGHRRQPELRHAGVAEPRPLRLRRRRVRHRHRRPARIGQIEDLFNHYFASLRLATEPAAFDGRSDYGPFIAVGIPAGGLFSGAEGVKTADEAAVYGGTAGEPYDPCYHQPRDDITRRLPFSGPQAAA